VSVQFLSVITRKNVGEQWQINHKTFFILAACFLQADSAISLSSDNFAFSGLSAMGLIYLFIGLANRDKREW
jgi:hypothetical protein